MVDFVEAQGFEAASAQRLESARQVLEECRPELVLLDLVLPDGNGIELLEELREEAAIEVIPLTGQASVTSAVAALRNGAFDYLTNPVDLPRLDGLLRQVRERYLLRAEIGQLRGQLRELGRFGSMVGTSAAMQEVFDLIEKVSPTDTSVLVIGETGTGKELAAEAIHRLSSRASRPLLAINCGAISANLIESELFGHEKGSFTGAAKQHQGCFERASGGTLFLDEIGEMPVELQVKLLRVLESGTIRRVGGKSEIEVDVRILAATNRDPDEAVREKQLREDLLYRLQVFPIELPPLRQRQGDVEALAQHFLRQLNRDRRTDKILSPQAMERLASWHWPGNVRELRNVLERAFIVADDLIDVDCLPDSIVGADRPGGPSLHIRVGTPLEEAARRLTLATLDQLEGNKTHAARTLGISVKTLYNRLKAYGE